MASDVDNEDYLRWSTRQTAIIGHLLIVGCWFMVNSLYSSHGYSLAN